MYQTIHTAGAGLPPNGGNFAKSPRPDWESIRIRTGVALITNHISLNNLYNVLRYGMHI